jgi:hypothetical protein
MVSSSGHVFAFGDTTSYGDAPGPLHAPIVAIATAPPQTHHPATLSTGIADITTSGTLGSDISNWQCGQPQPASDGLNIIQVDGASNSAPSPCLATQYAYPSSGPTQLYTFLTYGTQPSGPGLCHGDQACNFGYAAANTAYAQAAALQIHSPVWWLDVENRQHYWSTDNTANAALIRGAIAALTDLGVTVGIYSSQAEWSSITSGSGYSPAVPQWIADWLQNAPPFAPSSECSSSYAFVSGPIAVIQYTDGSGTNGHDDDYAC